MGYHTAVWIANAPCDEVRKALAVSEAHTRDLEGDVMNLKRLLDLSERKVTKILVIGLKN